MFFNGHYFNRMFDKEHLGEIEAQGIADKVGMNDTVPAIVYPDAEWEGQFKSEVQIFALKRPP
jgi:hypothetical protein